MFLPLFAGISLLVSRLFMVPYEATVLWHDFDTVIVVQSICQEPRINNLLVQLKSLL